MIKKALRKEEWPLPHDIILLISMKPRSWVIKPVRPCLTAVLPLNGQLERCRELFLCTSGSVRVAQLCNREFCKSEHSKDLGRRPNQPLRIIIIVSREPRCAHRELKWPEKVRKCCLVWEKASLCLQTLVIRNKSCGTLRLQDLDIFLKSLARETHSNLFRPLVKILRKKADFKKKIEVWKQNDLSWEKEVGLF